MSEATEYWPASQIVHLIIYFYIKIIRFSNFIFQDCLMMTFFTWGSQDGSGIAKEHFGISLKGRTTAFLNARRCIHPSTIYQFLCLSLFSSLFHSHQQLSKVFLLDSPFHFLHSQQATHFSEAIRQNPSTSSFTTLGINLWVSFLLSTQGKISFFYSRTGLSKLLVISLPDWRCPAEFTIPPKVPTVDPTDTWQSKSHIIRCRFPTSPLPSPTHLCIFGASH